MGHPKGYALRLQVTRRCQLRCGYCRPDGVEDVEPDGLAPPEAARLVGVLARLGVDRVRVTGGEPLLRADICGVVSALRAVDGIREVNLTTNGARLAGLAHPLKAAGLNRINVHVDTLDPERYQRLCGGRLDRALEGLRAAREAGLGPRVNVVVQRGWNDDEIPGFCELARALDVPVRFIELMDTGVAPDVARQRFVPGTEIAAVLEALGAVAQTRTGPAPARDYRFSDGTLTGIIASEGASFCGSCDRLRLDAAGTLRTCLYAGPGISLGALLRDGADDDVLAQAAAAEILGKTSLHPARRAAGAATPRFSMAAIGG